MEMLGRFIAAAVVIAALGATCGLVLAALFRGKVYDEPDPDWPVPPRPGVADETPTPAHPRARSARVRRVSPETRGVAEVQPLRRHRQTRKRLKGRS